MDRVAVFGIGSTNFRYAAATPTDGLLTEPRVEPTRPNDLAAQLLDAVATLSGAVDRRLDGVAVSVAGLADAERGVVRAFDTPAGETVDRIELGPRLSEEYGLGLTLVNDCNAAAFGEWHYGARTDERCVAHLTFGTGIGGGVVENGRLNRGESGQAGEFGLVSLDATSELESCGVTGAWEALCSGRGIPRFVAHRLHETDADSVLADVDDLTAEAVFDAADDDEFAAACLDRIDRYNAAGVAAVCNAVEPGLVTLGGGVALNNEARVRDGIARHLDDYCFVDPPEIRTTDLGDDIGLYGALATHRARVERERWVSGAEPVEEATD